MCDSNKNEIAGANPRFAGVSELEIAKNENNAVRENTKKTTKFILKVLKVRKELLTFDVRAASEDALGNHKPNRQVTLRLKLAEINTLGFIFRNIKCYLTKHLSHKYSEHLCART